MTEKLFPSPRRAGLLLLAFTMALPLPLRAQAPDAATAPNPREILRDALYAEEVTRDATKAAEHYEKVLEHYEAQQPFAATALFRLAEVRRKQGKKEEAAKLYQRLLREFPGAEVEGKLARENLAALGTPEGPAAAPGAVIVDQEAQELRRIQDLVKNTPDRAKNPQLARAAVIDGYTRVLEYLLDSGLETNPARLLPEAADSGHVKIVQMLIARAPKDAPEAQQALWDAVDENYKQVATVLLDSGVSPNVFAQAPVPPTEPGSRADTSNLGKISLLQLALRGGDLEMVRQLLDHGADPNKLSEKPSPGSPLHEAAGRGSLEAVKLLLSKGADPNLGAPATGWTPLHTAASANRPEALEALLQAGAKLEAKTTVTEPDPGKTSPNGGLTPLLAAARGTSPATLAVLLDKGADPNARSAAGTPALGLAVRSAASKQREETVRLLLARGADPKVRFGELKLLRERGHQDPFFSGSEAETVTDYSLLYAAASNAYEKPLPVISLLLDAGATAGPELSYTIDFVASRDDEGKVTRALAAQHRGPVNFEELPEMGNWKDAARTAYLETVVYPGLAARDRASLVVLQGKIKPVELTPSVAGISASPAKLLLANPNHLMTPPGGSLPTKIVLNLIRKKQDGSLSRTLLDPNAEAPFPDLLPGDILELALVYGTSSGQRPWDAFSADLRKKVRFPATIEINGEARELTLRGDLMVYDPRRPNEVPWLGAAGLVSLLTSELIDAGITVQRKGWPDIQAPLHVLSNSPDFALEAGDKIILRGKALLEPQEDLRKQRLLIKGEGLRWNRSYAAFDESANPDGKGNLPTLFQALADTDGAFIRADTAPPNENDILPLWLESRNLYPMTLFPYPDLSRIRIRRLQQDGTERVIPINLDRLIAAAAAGTLTSEQARAADPVLQLGDIVEIPTRPDKQNAPWKGWSDAEGDFFSKALDCRVQYIDPAGVISLREIRYRPARYIPWGASWVPLPPATGVATVKAAPALIPGYVVMELTRKDSPGMRAYSTTLFLRDGDAIKNLDSLPNSPRPRVGPPAQPGTPASPRPRVEETR